MTPEEHAVDVLESAVAAGKLRVFAYEIIAKVALGMAGESRVYCEIACKADDQLARAKADLERIEDRLLDARRGLAAAGTRAIKERVMEASEPLSAAEREALYELRKTYVRAECMVAPVAREDINTFVRAMGLGEKDPKTGQWLDPATARGVLAHEIRRVVIAPLAGTSLMQPAALPPAKIIERTGIARANAL